MGQTAFVAYRSSAECPLHLRIVPSGFRSSTCELAGFSATFSRKCDRSVGTAPTYRADAPLRPAGIVEPV